MTSFTRRLLMAGLCATFACTEGDDGAPWMPGDGSDVNAGGSPDGGAWLGGGTQSDAAPPASDPDAETSLDAGASGSPDAGDADAAEGNAGRGDAASSDRADAGRHGGRPDAGAPSGADEVLHATIIVRAGMTFDGEGRRFRAGPELGDGSQSESQKPLFELEDGARLVDVVLGSPAADGIHTYGDVTLENIVWEDIGEDALTIKDSGTVVLNGGSARDGDDKVFQINAASTFRVSNFVASDAGKFIRQNGKTTFKVDVFIDGCDISNMDEAIFRTDSSSSAVTMTNTRYSNIGDELFVGVTPANITTSNNTEY